MDSHSHDEEQDAVDGGTVVATFLHVETCDVVPGRRKEVEEFEAGVPCYRMLHAVPWVRICKPDHLSIWICKPQRPLL